MTIDDDVISPSHPGSPQQRAHHPLVNAHTTGQMHDNQWWNAGIHWQQSCQCSPESHTLYMATEYGIEQGPVIGLFYGFCTSIIRYRHEFSPKRDQGWSTCCRSGTTHAELWHAPDNPSASVRMLRPSAPKARFTLLFRWDVGLNIRTHGGSDMSRFLPGPETTGLLARNPKPLQHQGCFLVAFILSNCTSGRALGAGSWLTQMGHLLPTWSKRRGTVCKYQTGISTGEGCNGTGTL